MKEKVKKIERKIKNSKVKLISYYINFCYE